MTTKSFLATFAEEHKAITSGLSSLSTVSKEAIPGELEAVQHRLVSLNAEYTQHASSLPSYDQRRCQEQLKEISRILNAEKAKSVPKQKFSFKSRIKATSPATPTTTTPPPPPPPPVVSNSAIDAVADNGITLSISNTYLFTSPELHLSNIRLLSMIKSIINLTQPKQHATLHVRDLSNCLVVASEFDGAAHLTNLFDCIIVLKCHQFRMHESRGVKVFLSCSSRPIIENCQDIDFAAYPSAVAEKAGIQVSMQKEEWLSREMVDDFNWLRKEHSPNWTIQKDTVSTEQWGKLLDTMQKGLASVDRIREILKQKG